MFNSIRIEAPWKYQNHGALTPGSLVVNEESDQMVKVRNLRPNLQYSYIVCVVI